MASRKKFIEIEIPILKTEISALGTLENLENKMIKLDLTRKLRGRGCEIHLRIIKQEEKLIAIPNKIQLMKSYIRRMIRKRTSYIEDSFSVQSKDIKIIIKPFLITRKKVSRAVRKNLRQTAKEFIQYYTKEKTYLELCDEVLAGEFQKTLLPKLKKIYPLSFCDFRIFETNEIKNIEIQKEPSKEEEKEVVKKTEEEHKEEKPEEEKKKIVKKSTKKIKKKSSKKDE